MLHTERQLTFFPGLLCIMFSNGCEMLGHTICYVGKILRSFIFLCFAAEYVYYSNVVRAHYATDLLSKLHIRSQNAVQVQQSIEERDLTLKHFLRPLDFTDDGPFTNQIRKIETIITQIRGEITLDGDGTQERLIKTQLDLNVSFFQNTGGFLLVRNLWEFF